MAYTRTTEVTEIGIVLRPHQGQELQPRLRASITETIRDAGGEIVPYPEQRSMALLAQDISDDMLAQLNAAIEYAGVQMVRVAPGDESGV